MGLPVLPFVVGMAVGSAITYLAGPLAEKWRERSGDAAKEESPEPETMPRTEAEESEPPKAAEEAAKGEAESPPGS
jgi:hypothetical protein